jgi:hypothetical protein
MAKILKLSDASFNHKSIYVPSLKMRFAREQSLQNTDWLHTHIKLQKQNLRMPTAYEFAEFLKYLSNEEVSGSGRILNEILEGGEACWAANWIDARFEGKEDKIYLHQKHKFVNKRLTPTITEEVKDCVIDYKEIRLDEWIQNHTQQGLPKADSHKGSSLCYWGPEEGEFWGVMWIGGGSGRVDIYCNKDSESKSESLGVYACSDVA